ncbi:MAG: dTDP-4-dehydrorhamnose 3,5-epimerase family protein, partial [Chloroflexi bacterium]|nr:dTDP-4-dehydrorhamnose 3,5-epimerase family protein [Chloroflexota bacterium]
MEFIPTSLPEVQIIRPKIYSDQRGFFMETFQAQLCTKAGLPATFVQDNNSGSYRGILRGLHYPIRQAQGKLIRVVAGEIFDVAVDLRRNSPTFKMWVGVTLSAESRDQL